MFDLLPNSTQIAGAKTTAIVKKRIIDRDGEIANILKSYCLLDSFRLRPRLLVC